MVRWLQKGFKTSRSKAGKMFLHMFEVRYRFQNGFGLARKAPSQPKGRKPHSKKRRQVKPSQTRVPALVMKANECLLPIHRQPTILSLGFKGWFPCLPAGEMDSLSRVSFPSQTESEGGARGAKPQPLGTQAACGTSLEMMNAP